MRYISPHRPAQTPAQRPSCAMEATATKYVLLRPEPNGIATAHAELLAAFRDGARKVQARCLSGAARGHALAQLSTELKRPLVCVEPDEAAAEALEKDL